ncbi:RDD family protein [Antrihabitans spumae]|uniref:RDD family protein n=1 Tax=Antrihabitans spumae TaxID=3373370 RepID=A0ABW7KUB4_9NOCA
MTAASVTGGDTTFVTGEAVALDLPIARVPTRCLAFLIDLMLQLATLFGLLIFVGMVAYRADEALLAALVIVSTVAVLVGYPVAWETLTRGRSPGKFALGLRVVRADGGPAEFRHALTRGLCGAIVDFWLLGFFGLVAVVSSTCSARGRRVGDLLAGTVVIRSEAAYFAPSLLHPPPRMVMWAAQLDIDAVPDQLALLVRDYLKRYGQFAPPVAFDVGLQLTQRVCACMRVEVPAPIPPFEVLAAVLAERQRRALARPI